MTSLANSPIHQSLLHNCSHCRYFSQPAILKKLIEIFHNDVILQKKTELPLYDANEQSTCDEQNIDYDGFKIGINQNTTGNTGNCSSMKSLAIKLNINPHNTWLSKHQ